MHMLPSLPPGRLWGAIVCCIIAELTLRMVQNTQTKITREASKEFTLDFKLFVNIQGNPSCPPQSYPPQEIRPY